VQVGSLGLTMVFSGGERIVRGTVEIFGEVALIFVLDLLPNGVNLVISRNSFP
jgi:hypothetical protein